MGGDVVQRHNRVRRWVADKCRQAWGGTVREEVPHPATEWGPEGRMDVQVDSGKGHFDVDIVVPAVVTTCEAELARRQCDPDRALRRAVASKLQRYGPSVVAFAIDDAGRISTGAARFLRKLAGSLDPGDVAKTFAALRAEGQHVVMQGTAVMAQASRGAARTG